MAAITICSDFGAQKSKVCHCFHCLPIYLLWSDGTRCHDLLVFWMLSFKPTFSLPSFTFIKRLFSSSLSAIRVVSSAYLRLLIFLPAIMIPACASSSPAGFPCSSVSKESACNAGDLGSFLGQEDPLEKEMAIHSWKSPWTEESGGLQSMGLKESDNT